MTRFTKFLIIIPFMLFVASCSSSRLFTQDETLYVGADVEVVEREDVNYSEKELKNMLASYIYPEPNKTLFGIFRPKLWLYARSLDTTRTFRSVRSWTAEKFGEEPVYYGDHIPKRVSQILNYRLEYYGYYNCSLWYETETIKNKTEIVYTVKPCKRLITGNVNIPESKSLIWQLVHNNFYNTLLVPGEVFSLEVLEKERERIVQDIKEEGFYFFNENYILFVADTLSRYPYADVTINLSQDVPLSAQREYYVSNIFVDIRERNREAPVGNSQPYNYNGITFVNNAHKKVSHSTIRAAVLIENDSIYTLSKHRNSLNRIMGLSFVNTVDINFTRVGDSDTLECRINIYPKVRKSIQAEAGAFAKNNQRFGPDAAIFFANRNFLNSAGEYRIGVNSEIEYQRSEDSRDFRAYKTGFETSLSLPGMILPWKKIFLTGSYIPITRFNIEISQFVDFDLYKFLNYGSGISYIWNTTPRLYHNLSPFSISYSQISDETDFFLEIARQMPFVAASFRNYFIFGPSYNLNYTTAEFFERLKFNKIVHLEISGIPVKELSDPTFSNFYKADFDLRGYFKTSENSVLASRLYFGIGIPYGHSIALPFNRLYAAGGSTGIRGFSMYGLGPGAYVPDDDAPSSVERTGDIRLQMSVEQRFPIIGILKGATFADAGNVWLYNIDSQREQGKFNFDDIYVESAVATGAGLRLDPGFFVFRFDAAFPVKMPGDAGINTDGVDFKSKQWRKNKLVYNLAIGYPF